MTSPEAFDERKARQQFVRDRQKIVFTIAIALLAVILVVAFLFYFGVLGKSSSAKAAEKPNYGVIAPCATTDNTGTAKTVANGNVTVRVLNGTDKSGLANAVSSALKNRGFVTKGVADYPGTTTLKRTEIRFGKNAINQAYTVAGHFNDAIMRMDDRSDKLVDVVIGSTFSTLTDENAVKTGADQQITSFQNCVAADKITNLPKAVDHAAVK
ncbi:hypothetical protein CS006_03520 [Bifidobacterium primatium]|uniref:LytR/CpsA/Psr regulator C-terminal domain-containing protein n=1 Tax=Bifidobacterium primatium TaxID=2045438 RepID=A0A2M9HBL4_9BIFI|nr:LytR C-terminal domain-containing protein [Bifidobacterium primatium]PJM74204.1 hypothetical protein CS006_03520 [Bifidobacterium primatium]